jgi:hypothetical protein
MDDIWDEIVGDDKPTAKTLFKLIAREGSITVDDSAQLLGADRKDVDSWVRLLLGKKYVIAEGNPSNPTLRLSEEIMAKIEERTWGAGQKAEGPAPARTSEVERERQLRRSLEEALKDKEHIIDGLQDELLSEKKERAYLEEKVRFMEMRMKDPSGLADLGVQLERERSERLKLEGLLRRRQEELDILRPSEKPVEAPEPAKAEEPEEDKKPVELRSWAQLAGGEVKARDTKPEETKEEPTEPTELKAPEASNKEKDATDLVRLLLTKGTLKEKDAALELGVEEKAVKAWVEELAGKGAVTVNRHLFGGRDILLAKGADVDAIIGEVHTQRIREELTRLRGAK